MDLKKSLKKLKELEQLEKDIEMNAQDRDALRLDIEDQEERLRKLKQRRDETKHKRSHALKEADTRETQMSAAEEENEKLSIQRNSTKNQAQFKAMGDSIASNLADIEKWENEELLFLEKADELKEEARRIEEDIQRAEEKLETIKNRVEKQTREYDAKIRELKQKKNQIREEIPPNVLEKYDNIARSRGSSALVTVKNRVCQGCHTMLPKQTENALLKCTEIVHCHNCGRMLMIDEDSSKF